MITLGWFQKFRQDCRQPGKNEKKVDTYVLPYKPTIYIKFDSNSCWFINLNHFLTIGKCNKEKFHLFLNVSAGTNMEIKYFVKSAPLMNKFQQHISVKLVRILTHCVKTVLIVILRKSLANITKFVTT